MSRADELSGGQQQRVAIARALMQQPAMVLADEPIASLDPLNAKSVMDALADLNQRDGITVVCNLHTLDMPARTYYRRIVGMAAGRIVFDGPPGTLTRSALRAIYGETDGRVDERMTGISLSSTVGPILATLSHGKDHLNASSRFHTPGTGINPHSWTGASRRLENTGARIPHRPSRRREYPGPIETLRCISEPVAGETWDRCQSLPDADYAG